MPKLDDNWVSLNIAMPKDLHVKLKKIADTEDRTIASIFRLAANDWLRKRSRKTVEPELSA